MPRPAYADDKQRRLSFMLAILFVGLALPSALLIRQGFNQIGLAEFRRQQLLAEDLVRGIDSRLMTAMAVENARPATDFEYAVNVPEGAGNALQLSPLSTLAAAGSFPGTIGYFQVDPSGQLSTPLLPESDAEALPAAEFAAKSVVAAELADVLEANRLTEFRRDASEAGQRAEESAEESAEQRPAQRAVGGARSVPQASASIRGQAVFDELVGASAADAAPESAGREDAGVASESVQPAIRVSAFAAEIEPLRFGALETGHFVLFRNAWRDGERYVQGMLVDRDAFIDDSFAQAFASAGLAPGTRMTAIASGSVVTELVSGDGSGDRQPDGSLLYETRLSPPLAQIEIDISTGILERGPGFNLLAWTALALFGVLIGGFAAMYRFGVRQLELARQQQNFVSAVSHELKTPLTSIRMYGEMLKFGWADDDKKQVYYDYIYDEGERLSRLIENVLQLARMNSGRATFSLEPVTIGELFDVLRSKLATQTERAGFGLEFDIDDSARGAVILADIDPLTQVFINLVDNAIKFSGDSDRREVRIGARCRGRDAVILSVRDFGPGIPPAEMKRLFVLFYRPDNELTRTTTGTGIGLALVRQLVTAMAGRVDVRNLSPGAEFRLTFPLANGD